MMSIRKHPQFLRYWIGDTGSAWWSQAFQVALFWTLATHAHGAQQLGWLSFWSTIPVLAGGPIVARLFHRLGVRPVMVADFILRTAAYAALTVWLAWPGLGQMWFIDAASAVWGLTFIANASGGPSLWPRLIPKEHLPVAMKLEQTGWNISAVGGAVTGGLLVMILPLTVLALMTAVVFAVASLNLYTLSIPPQHETRPPDPSPHPATIRPWRVIRSDIRLWAPLIVFWMSNLGAGGLTVIEPMMVHHWHAPAFFYGLLGALAAIAATTGAWYWPSRHSSRPMLVRLWIMEAIAGVAMTGYWVGLSQPVWAFIAAILSAGLAGGTSVMVLQLRFDALVEDIRAMVLTHIRTLLHTAGPIGALIAGQWIGHHALGPAIGATAILSIVPSVSFLLIGVGHEKHLYTGPGIDH